MPFSTTLIFYLLLGTCTAISFFVSERNASDRLMMTVLALLFWPIMLPMLLARSTEIGHQIECPKAASELTSNDSMSVAISQVEKELDKALQSLDGWSEGMLSREAERISELKSAWSAQAERIRELDQLLAEPGFDSDEPEPRVSGEDRRINAAEETRQNNIRRLREMRSQMHRDLMGTLAWVRELVTMIHLARFSGAPAARAEELVAQIAAAVEGLSEVSKWTPDSGASTVVSNANAI